MNHIEVREYLKSYRRIKKNAENLKLKLEEVRSDIYGLRATDYERIRVDGAGPDGSSGSLSLMDYEKQIENRLEFALIEKYKIYNEVIRFIGRLPNDNHDADILTDYYINDLGLFYIGKKYGYDYQSVKNKMYKAYKKLAIFSIISKRDY